MGNKTMKFHAHAKTIMKKLLAVTLATTLCFSLAACSSDEEETTEQEVEEIEEEVEEDLEDNEEEAETEEEENVAEDDEEEEIEEEDEITELVSLTTSDGSVVNVHKIEGFSYDDVYSGENNIFLDYDNEYFSFVFLYLYDLGEEFYYEPENYYDDEIQYRLDNEEDYPNAEATEFESVEINGYTVWYSILTYDTDDGDVSRNLYSFSDLGHDNLSISVEIETFSEEELDSILDGDFNTILETLYSNIEIISSESDADDNEADVEAEVEEAEEDEEKEEDDSSEESDDEEPEAEEESDDESDEELEE